MNNDTANKKNNRGMPADLPTLREAAEAWDRAERTQTDAKNNLKAHLKLVKKNERKAGKDVQTQKDCGGNKQPRAKSKNLPVLAAMADEAIKAGLMGAAVRPAALSLAGQIARLESRFEQYYRMGDEDEETKRAQSTPEALDKMGKCEKQLADLKNRFFELTGIDRQYAVRTQLAELQCRAAEKDGEVVLKLEGFGQAPMQE